MLVGKSVDAMEKLKNVLCSYDKNCIVQYYTNTLFALTQIVSPESQTDAVFADSAMNTIDVIEFRTYIHNKKPKIKVIIVDDNDDEALTPKDLILVRPVTLEKVVYFLSK